jgi:hypothetical protein
MDTFGRVGMDKGFIGSGGAAADGALHIHNRMVCRRKKLNNPIIQQIVIQTSILQLLGKGHVSCKRNFYHFGSPP